MNVEPLFSLVETASIDDPRGRQAKGKLEKVGVANPGTLRHPAFTTSRRPQKLRAFPTSNSEEPISAATACRACCAMPTHIPGSAQIRGRRRRAVPARRGDAGLLSDRLDAVGFPHAEAALKYARDQLRDKNGRWTDGDPPSAVSAGDGAMVAASNLRIQVCACAETFAGEVPP